MEKPKRDQKRSAETRAQLIHDLKTSNTLCRVKDYPQVSLEQLNAYVAKHGPIKNPIFGRQPEFFVEEGHFVPRRMVVFGMAAVATKIAALVDHWACCSEQGGTVTGSQGAFVLDRHLERLTVRMPDVAYTPRHDTRDLDPQQQWTYNGKPFVPTFVVEVDKLYGRGSRRAALDRKMRNEYFQHGVQLGWLIDPHPPHRRMYEYFVDEHGHVQCSEDSSWRNLGGRDVLPGLTLLCVDLEMVLNQDSGSSSEEEVDLTCPLCSAHLRSLSAWAAHGEGHRAQHARQTYLAKQANR